MSIRHRLPLTGAGLSATLGQWTLPGMVAVVQRGTIAITGATSNTATITSVDPSNSQLRLLGVSLSVTTLTPDKFHARLAFTNATTITASVITSPAGETVSIAFEVLTYVPGVIKSVQRTTIAILAGTTSNTATINPVNTLRSVVDNLGNTSSSNTADTVCRVALTNATTVTGTCVDPADGSTQTLGVQVIEWF